VARKSSTRRRSQLSIPAKVACRRASCEGGLPEGQLFHAAGPSAGGWTIVAVHESQRSWERFRDSVLMPKMAAGIEGGFTVPPQETSFEVYNEVTA